VLALTDNPDMGPEKNCRKGGVARSRDEICICKDTQSSLVIIIIITVVVAVVFVVVVVTGS